MVSKAVKTEGPGASCVDPGGHRDARRCPLRAEDTFHALLGALPTEDHSLNLSGNLLV